MNYKSKFILLALSIFICVLTINAQNAISASGGDAKGSGGKSSYTIGQIVYTTNTGMTASVAKGVQQPYEISVITEVDQPKDISLIIKVYPNPTSDLLILRIEANDIANFSYWIYGFYGNLISTKKILTKESLIDLGNQVSGTYYLKVTLNNKKIRLIKIIKN